MIKINKKLFNEKADKVFEKFGEPTIEDLWDFVNTEELDITDIIKTPAELLLAEFDDFYGEEKADYKVQLTFYSTHSSEYILLGRYGHILSFMITNMDYNVFSVSADGKNPFFTSPSDTQLWLNFLKVCEEVKRIIYGVKNYEFEKEED